MTDVHEHGLWTCDQQFLGREHDKAEARARLAATLTAGFMAIEITAGIVFGSMDRIPSIDN